MAINYYNNLHNQLSKKKKKKDIKGKPTKFG